LKTELEARRKISEYRQPVGNDGPFPFHFHFHPALPQRKAKLNAEKKEKSFDWSSSNTVFLVENYNPKDDP